MNNPWELMTEDVRTSDNLYTFIIFCEDEVSENLYFKWFESEKTKINIIPNQKSMFDNVIQAMTYCIDNGILQKENDSYCCNINDVEIWCVYDRDTNRKDLLVNNENFLSDNLKFDESISLALKCGIKVAWSNDAFELWILLHFEDVNPEDEQTHIRTYYYDRLTEIFRIQENPNEDLRKALVHPTFSYKKDLKKKNNFRDIVRPLVLPKTLIADERARKLVAFHSEKTNHFDKKPCTLVYELIENIKSKGGKSIPTS